MESKIMFLIITILALYVLFSQKGQEWLRYYTGIDVKPAKTSNTTETVQKQAEKDTRPNEGTPFKLNVSETVNSFKLNTGK